MSEKKSLDEHLHANLALALPVSLAVVVICQGLFLVSLLKDLQTSAFGESSGATGEVLSVAVGLAALAVFMRGTQLLIQELRTPDSQDTTPSQS